MSSIPIRPVRPFPFLTTQLIFFAPDVMEATVRIGMVRSTKHVQVQVEVTDPSTSSLIAMAAVPHTTLDCLEPILLDALEEILEVFQILE